jgi:hypothetical protein
LLLREKQAVPEDVIRSRREAETKRELIGPQHAALQKYYEEQLASYQEQFGRTATSISVESRQYERLQAKRDQVVRTLVAAAKGSGINLTEKDLEPFSLQISKPGLWGGNRTESRVGQFVWDKDFKQMPPALSLPETPGEASVKKVETYVQTLGKVAELFGIDAVQTGDKSQYLQNIKSPINARFTDAMGFAESVQTQALNVGDKDAENAQNRLNSTMERLEGTTGGLLREVNANLKALQSAVANLRWWEGR